MIIMNTKVLTPSDENLKLAADIIKNGGLVAFPTETVYGLGVNALLKDGAPKVYMAKGRPSDNPLIIHLATPEDAEKYCFTNKTYYKIAELFMPGPVTFILPKKEIIPDCVTGGLDTVAVRIPSNPVANKLISYSGVPIAAPSANLSGRPSTTTADHCIADLFGKIDAIIDGGECEIGLESTILTEKDGVLKLLRPGGVTVEMLENAGFSVSVDKAVLSKLSDNEKPLAPGMKYRHYAPKARVYILKGTLLEVKEFLEKKKGFVGKIGVLCFDEMVNELSGLCETVSLGKMNCPEDAAKRLFSALRKMDELGANLIFAPEIPEDGLWLAVKNRLYKAAGGSIIDVKNTKALLFICMGNTCRSPMAEGIFAQVNKNVIVSSAGLSAGGEGANEKAILAAKKLGADISSHKSKTVRLEMLKAADVVVTMTESIKAVLPFPEKTVTLYELAGESGDIADPYGQSQEVYDTCAREIKRLAEKSMKL